MDESKNVDDSSGNLSSLYAENSFVRALIQLIPLGIGGAGDVLFMDYVERMRKRRAKVFFDELDSGEIVLSESVIRSEEFLHRFFIATRVALNAQRDEKIRNFAKLLKSSVNSESNLDNDEFEEYVSILDELSYREWLALLILDEFSYTERSEEQNDLQWSNDFWIDFKDRVSDELKIDHDEVVSFLNRISRTGLYEQIVGGFMDYEGGVGVLTKRFHKLKCVLIDREEGL